MWSRPLRRLADGLWAILKIATIGGVIYLGSCTSVRTIFKQAPLSLPADFSPLTYTPLPPERALPLLEKTYYGRVPRSSTVEILSRDMLDENALNGKARLMQWRLRVSYNGVGRELDMVGIFPLDHPDAPLILSQNFCPNNAVVPLEGVRAPDANMFCSDSGLFATVMTYIFGRYIVTPPLEEIMDRGYGFAAIYPSQFIPDSRQGGLNALETLFGDDPDRPGALSVWASLFNDMANVIEADIGQREVYAYGHSRFGKTALMAAAWFENIDGAIAHQSGTLGASSLTDGTGESVADIARSYPHWGHRELSRFSRRPEALPVRPADLLNAIRPKPVLLGNARRDVWSDPFGAFTEAKLAFGADMSAHQPEQFKPDDRYAYWLRPGTHGVVEEDWPTFLDFLDAHTQGSGKPARQAR